MELEADGDGAPQPAPISLAVRVSGTFIIDAAVVVVEGAGGAGSGVDQALPPPQGSMLAGRALAIDAVDAAGAWGLGGGGALMLKAELSSCCGDEMTGGGDGDATAAGAGGGDDRPNRSFDRDDDGGGFGLVGGGEAKPPNPESNPLEEIDVVRDWGLAGGMVGEVRLSNKLPPPPVEMVGEEILGAAGVDFAKLVRLAKGEGFSAGFGGGGDVVDGKLNPLNASVRPPTEEADCGGGDARSPNEVVR